MLFWVYTHTQTKIRNHIGTSQTLQKEKSDNMSDIYAVFTCDDWKSNESIELLTVINATNPSEIVQLGHVVRDSLSDEQKYLDNESDEFIGKEVLSNAIDNIYVEQIASIHNIATVKRKYNNLFVTHKNV